MSDVKNGTMNIGGTVYITKETEISHTQLRFYTKNPRVFSELIHEDDYIPSQSEIENHMISTDRVKELKEKIKANNGLINPVIVRDGDFSVLEGNTRLAAYRILSKSEPENPAWEKMKCIILPENISEDAISILLGAYHIKGTKDWDPYEQAGYLYRWKQNSKLPTAAMAKQLGVTNGTVESMINVYSFMKEKDDLDKNHWSYYEEYLKNASLKKFRDNNPNCDTIFVNEVTLGKFPSAQFVRKFGEVVKGTSKEEKKIQKKIIDGEISIKDGYDILVESGKLDDGLKKLEKIRATISTDAFENQILELDGEAKKEAVFKLKKVYKKVEKMLKKMGADASE